MIERIPDEINLQTGACGDTQFDIIPKETFAMVCRKVNEIIDRLNNMQPKKPKSTNIALRQRIAEMETALKHIIGISGAGLSAQERIADIKEMAKCGLDPQYSPILVGRYTYPLKTEISVVE